jgi:hypothetical protein
VAGEPLAEYGRLNDIETVGFRTGHQRALVGGYAVPICRSERGPPLKRIAARSPRRGRRGPA